MGFHIHNSADTRMEFRIKRQSARVSNTVAVITSTRATDGDVIERGGERIHIAGIAVMPPVMSTPLEAEIEVEFAYGRPGKLSYTGRYHAILMATMDANGEVVVVNSHPR